jgi:hypothetical protein
MNRKPKSEKSWIKPKNATNVFAQKTVLFNGREIGIEEFISLIPEESVYKIEATWNAIESGKLKIEKK